MTYTKYNKDKSANIRMGEFFENKTLLEESADFEKDQSGDSEINMLRESMTSVNRAIDANRNVIKRQKYLNESNWYALKSYITKLSIDQARGLYDFKSIKEEYGMDPEIEIEQEVEEQLMTELPLSIQGEMGTIIPIKIQVTPETADVVQAVLKLMDQKSGDGRFEMETGEIEDAANNAMDELPGDNPSIINASDKIADDTVNIIAKDQEVLAGIKEKMDALEDRVSEQEYALGLAADSEYEQPALGTTPEGGPELVQDPETGLLVDVETGDIYDPETGEIIKEELHREHRIQTVIEALAVRKAGKILQEGILPYNRDISIVGGINTLIIMETFNHVFGRKISYEELKKKLYIK